MKVKFALVKCSCGKRYSNPLTHVCVTQFGKQPGKTRVKPQTVIKCRCGKPLGNPLTHVCRETTDFKKRKAAAEKAAKKPQARTGTAHEYTTCDDDDCSKYPCRVYKQGLADGEVLGRQVGYAEGWAQGYPEEIAACPRSHQG